MTNENGGFRSIGEVMTGFIAKVRKANEEVHEQYKQTTESDNMNKTRGAEKRVIDLTGSTFLKKKGLPRDKAMFVTLLIRARADMVALRKMISDPDVVEEIDTTVGMLSEQVDFMYTLVNEESGGDGYTDGPGAA